MIAGKSNVISFRQPRAQAGALSAQVTVMDDSYLYARIAAPFALLKEKGELALLRALQLMFDQVDDALFELADRASNNNEQNMYFESMREVRVGRRGMEQAFLRSVRQGFELLLPRAVEAPGQELPVLHDEVPTLSLVENDELEELMAVDSMVARVESQQSAALSMLGAGLSNLFACDEIVARDNPFGPRRICVAFVDVCRSLTLDTKAKLILFKLFDRHVLSALAGLYEQSNQLLRESGIDCRAKVALPHTATTGEKRSDQDSGESQGSECVDQDQFVHLQGLLHKGQGEASDKVATDESDAGVGAANFAAAPLSGQRVSPEQLMVLLKAVQQLQMQDMADQLKLALSGQVPVMLDVRTALQGLLANTESCTDMHLRSRDDDAINLVAMLFQFILDDRNLAAPIKALIARLQIPIVKVAMLDSSFFSKSAHPARKLLNEIAMAGLGWEPVDDAHNDALYRKIESVVGRLLDEFDTDVALFSEVLADFVGFVEADRRRARLVQQRMVDAETGKARSEQARQVVASMLEERCARHELPEEVARLLNQGWSNVLFLLYLKDGEQSDAWHAAWRTVDDLIWSVQPLASADDRKRLLKLLPGMLRDLRAGLTRIAFNPFELNQLFADLELLHLTQLKSVPAQSTQPSVAEPEELADEPLQAPVLDMQQLDAALNQQFGDDFDAEFGAIESSVSETPISAPAPAVDSAAEQAGAANAEQPAADQPEDVPPAESWLQRVDGLSMGSWVEMQQASGERFRARLAAVIRATGKYIYVNRSGIKVAEYTRDSLAQALASGQLNLLDDSLLFDRALESVIGNLRSMKSSSQ